MTRDEMKRLRRTWRRGGLPGFGTTPPVVPVPAPRPVTEDEAAERLPWDTAELDAIYPDAGEGWRAER